MLAILLFLLPSLYTNCMAKCAVEVLVQQWYTLQMLLAHLQCLKLAYIVCNISWWFEV